MLLRSLLRWRAGDSDEHPLRLLDERLAEMVLDDFHGRRSVESMRRRVENRKHQVLQVLVLFERDDFELLLLQFLARDVSAVALEVAVIGQPIGNAAGLGFSVALALEHPGFQPAADE